VTEEETYYWALRAVARKRALVELNSLILAYGGAKTWNGTTLASIDEEAIRYAEEVWPSYYGEDTHPGFVKPWSSIWYHALLQPSRFDIAVWQEIDGRRVLQGLATGTRSHGNSHLTLNWVERNFGPEYTRYGVLVPILSSFEHYAHLLDVDRVLIKNPVDPSKYERYGYTPFRISGSTTLFLSKEMKNG
jgi:hypothetical protein